MLRPSLLFGALLGLTLFAANGCQSCSSCHDYDPPVANCHCTPGPQACSSGGCSSCGCNGDYSEYSPQQGNTYTQNADPNGATPVAARAGTTQTYGR